MIKKGDFFMQQIKNSNFLKTVIEESLKNHNAVHIKHIGTFYPVEYISERNGKIIKTQTFAYKKTHTQSLKQKR
ncbi:hypothetical protein CSE_02510 [Caldisericum exile AZM16c01]|uniref:Uncharacterized protein n=1 Tax=Caldisericum exile (strain DSM 21853 / NBRC 104410 / AZM16c01) TaxID=511051 RepID=A0A7U6JGK4_CALEA|nr:hypothetical protein CSE_02510 [Caldisericum exile AZM16c01]